MSDMRGSVIWITGLSGAGKSSIAGEVVKTLKRDRMPVVLLDGDAVRVAVADPYIGHDRDSRLVNAWRICRFAQLLANQGLTVVVATMSLFKEVHTWNRVNLPGYFEVFVQVDLNVLKQRDARGLYSRAINGNTSNVVGIHLDYDAPSAPDLVLDNNSEADNFIELAQQILAGHEEKMR